MRFAPFQPNAHDTMSRTRRALWTYASGLASTAVTMAIAMVALPVLLTRLGEERYGAFRAIVDWYGYIALFELGVDGALLALFAKAVAQGDGQRVRWTLATGIRAYVGITCLMLVAGLSLAAVMKHLVSIDNLYTTDLRIACGIAVAALLVVPLTPFRSLTEACQEGYWVNAAALAQSLVTTALALWLAFGDWGISGQMSAVAIGNVLFLGLLGWRRYRRLPRRQDETGNDREREIWRDLRRLNAPILLRRVCGRVGLLSDCLIVSALLGPSLVVPLYFTQRLAVLVQSQLQAIGSASWAGMASLHARGQLQTFNRRLIELTTAVAVLGLAVLMPIVAYNRHFIGRWVGDQHYGGDLLTLVAACNAFLLSVTTLWDWCFGGTGRVARLVPMSLIATAVNVILSIVLTCWLGPICPLLGTFFSLGLCTMWYLPLLLHKTFQTPLRPLIMAVMQPLVWGLPYGGLLWRFARQHEPWGWIGLASEMAAATLLFLALAWVAVFTADERAAWISRLRLLLRFRSTTNARVPPPVALG